VKREGWGGEKKIEKRLIWERDTAKGYDGGEERFVNRGRLLRVRREKDKGTQGGETASGKSFQDRKKKRGVA